MSRGPSSRSNVGGSDRGSVTAELALALPAVTMLLAMVITLGSAAISQLRCADAARAGARAAALGDSPADVAAIARRLAGEESTVAVDRTGQWVTVAVSDAVDVGPLSYSPLRARATATARVEPQ